MLLLRKYIIKKSLSYILLLLLIVVIIVFVFNVMSEVKDLKIGSYSIYNMITYITLLIPEYTYIVLPIAVLIGCNLAIHSLIKSYEYVIIVSSGLSKFFIISNFLLLTTIIAIFTFILGNYIIPHSENFAHTYKNSHIKHNYQQQYLWLKEKIDSNRDRFIKIEKLELDNNNHNCIRLNNINIFDYKQQQLQQYIYAKDGVYQNYQFILKMAETYNYSQYNLTPIINENLVLNSNITNNYLLNISENQEMSVNQLVKLINYLKHNRQNTIAQEVSLYSKITYPILCLLMSVSSILFIPYNFRHSSANAVTLLNIIIGLFIFFINQFAQYIILYLGLPKISSIILLLLSIIIVTTIAITKK